MSFWRRKKPQHPPASSLLDDPVSDQETSRLPPPAIPTTTEEKSQDTPSQQQSTQQHLLDLSDVSQSPSESSPSPPTPPQLEKTTSSTSTSIRRLSRFNLFRRSSSSASKQQQMSPQSPVSPGAIAPKSQATASNVKPDHSDPHTLSPQPRPRNRTPSASPYASPRTSIYGALSSPATSSNPGEIFERSIESVPSVSTQSPSITGVPTHQVLEDIIPPALEATAATFTDHVNPDDVEIVTFSEVQSSDSRSQAGSPVPSSPILTAPIEATANPWETTEPPPPVQVPLSTGSPDLESKKRTLSLMSAVDHLADEIIHPQVPNAAVDKKPTLSPLSLSPAITPADVPSVRVATSDLSMERSPSQSSQVGDVVVMKQTMREALSHKRLHQGSLVASPGDVSPTTQVGGSASPEPIVSIKPEELEANPWSQ